MRGNGAGLMGVPAWRTSRRRPFLQNFGRKQATILTGETREGFELIERWGRRPLR